MRKRVDIHAKVPLCAAFVLAALCCTSLAHADLRFCGPPERNADGTIKRSEAVLSEFQSIHPRSRLPVFLGADGKPERWIIDHPVPLACCGCDSVENLQWLNESAWRAKSLWERKVYGGRGCSKRCP